MALWFAILVLLAPVVHAACLAGGNDWTKVAAADLTAMQTGFGTPEKYRWMLAFCTPEKDFCPNIAFAHQKKAEGGEPGKECEGNFNAPNPPTLVGPDGGPITATWQGAQGSATATITCSPSGGSNVVALKGDSYTVTPNPDQSSFVYAFQMESKCACKGGCSGGGGGGLIFIIILLVVIVLYIVVGCVFNVVKRELRGMAAFPHIDFWKDLPFLVKDGCCFIAGKCGRGGYSSK